MKVWLQKCWAETGFQICGAGTAERQDSEAEAVVDHTGQRLHGSHSLRDSSMSSQTLPLEGGDKEVERIKQNFSKVHSNGRISPVNTTSAEFPKKTLIL